VCEFLCGPSEHTVVGGGREVLLKGKGQYG
jgi:hypothetical protein